MKSHFNLPLPALLQRAYAAQLCMVCGTQLGSGRSKTSHACEQSFCQHHYQHIHRLRHQNKHLLAGKISSDLPHCSICTWPLTPDEAAGVPVGKLSINLASCSSASCIQQVHQREVEQQHQLKLFRCRIEKKRKQWLVEFTRNLEHERDDARLNAEQWPLIMLPGNSRKLSPLPQARIREFGGYLMDIIQQALAQPPEKDKIEQSTVQFPITSAACKLCKGNCCMAGGNRAYLDILVIHKYLHTFPEATSVQIKEAFLEKLPGQVYENSCIYHGESGCGLGEWRSRTCQEHYCDPLRDAFAQGTNSAWGVSITSGEPHWTRWPWPRQDDEVLGWGCLS